MQLESKYFLLVVSLLCLALTWYSFQKKQEDKIPYVENLTKILPAIGGGAYAINFLFNLAK